MIPWSDAVEALAWLEPAAQPAPRLLFENAQWLAVEKHAGEPIVSADLQQPSLQKRVRLAHGEALTAVDHWGVGVSGVCWFAKSKASEVGLRRALHGAERELSLLVRGNLRKQGTVTRRSAEGSSRGARYKKLRDLARHSLASALVADEDEVGALRDFASISHPVLGTFLEVFPEIKKRLQGQIVVAHNESFDRSVLQKSMAMYELPYQDLDIKDRWECTVKLYRAKGLKPTTLKDCCRVMNIKLQHHEALSDARACAKLYVAHLLGA